MIQLLFEVCVFVHITCMAANSQRIYHCIPKREESARGAEILPQKDVENGMTQDLPDSVKGGKGSMNITFGRKQTVHYIRQCSAKLFLHGARGIARVTVLTPSPGEQTVSLKHNGGTTGTINYLQLQVSDDQHCPWYPQTVTTSERDKQPVQYTCSRFRNLAPLLKNRPRLRRTADRVFRVIVYTGSDFGAGTGARVFVVIHGEKADEPEQRMDGSFQLSSNVTTELESGNIGKVKAITIRHDNSGYFGAWQLEQISMFDDSEEIGRFVCSCWLDSTDDTLKRRIDNIILCTPSGGECGRHGSCVDGTSCDCNGGYTGEFCTIPPCTLNGGECGSHGICYRYGSSYGCNCTDNYNGTLCKIPPCTADGGECGSHGACNTEGSANFCECSQHYDGTLCTTPPCTPGGGQCGSQGSCKTEGTTNFCDCTGGYSGTFCTIFAPPCTPGGNECGSHGSCSSNNECNCTNNYKGQLCTIPPCTINGGECGKHGSCNTGGSANVCDCTGNYSGHLCTIPPCTVSGTECGKHGTCEISNSTAACLCSNGYAGPFCGTELLCTADGNQCKNGGKCMTDTASHRCQCNAWYSGTTCDIRRNSAVITQLSPICFLLTLVIIAF